MYRMHKLRAERRMQRRERSRKIKGICALSVYAIVLLLLLGILMIQQENEKLKQRNVALLDMVKVEAYEGPSEGIKEEATSLGKFQIYHYCPCVKCCGKSDGITSTGARAREGRTIAVDPEVIPLGSTVMIDGEEYIAEDTGGKIKGNKIDVFVESHQEAIQKGTYKTDVYLKK